MAPVASEEQALIAPEQQHGQERCARWNPLYNAPLRFLAGSAVLIASTVPLAVYWDEIGSPWVWLALAGAIALGLYGLYLMRSSWSQSLRRSARLGIWPVAEPSSLQEIVALMKESEPPIAVGEGWKHHLAGTKETQKCIALGANWSGIVSWTEDSVRVRAGMLWGEVIHELWKKGRAPLDRPAFDGISLGASVRVGAHGWTLDGWFIEHVRAIQAVERGTGRVAEARQNGGDDFWKLAFGDDWVITEVEFQTQKNRLVRVQMKSQPLSEATTAADFEKFYEKEGGKDWRSAPMATMHIEHQKVERKWVIFDDDSVTTDELEQTCCAFRTRFLGIGVSGTDSLVDAMTSIRTAWAVEIWGWNASGNIDIELLVREKLDWDKVALIMSKFHRKIPGPERTDLRERSYNGVTVTGVDAVIRPEDLPAWFGVLYDEVGLRSGVLHPGKHVPKNTGKIDASQSYGSFWREIVASRGQAYP